MVKVLILDDSKEITNMLSELIGFMIKPQPEVVVAHEIADAKSKYLTEKPDIVVSDYDLGGGSNAVPFIAYVREQNSGVPIIMNTATSVDDIKMDHPEIDSFKVSFCNKDIELLMQQLKAVVELQSTPNIPTERAGGLTFNGCGVDPNTPPSGAPGSPP